MLIVKDPPPEAIDEGTKADPADFAKQATDLQTLRDAVVDAASVGGSLWLSYLFVFFYLAIAAGGRDPPRPIVREPGQAAVPQCGIAAQGLLHIGAADLSGGPRLRVASFPSIGQ